MKQQSNNNATRVYQLLDTIVGSELSSDQQLKDYDLDLYNKFIQWDDGRLKDSFFMNYLAKLVDAKAVK